MFRFLRIHTVPSVAEEGGSTWLQLFFDLVYVAILVELGNRLSHDLTLKSTIEFAILFIPILWSWLEFVNYGRYFPTDDIGQRLLTVLYMAVMLAMALEVHDLTGASATKFIFAYALSKFVLALMYARAWYQYPKYREMTSHHVVAFILIGLLWTGIALVAPNNPWLWALAIILVVLSPVFITTIRKLTGRFEQPHPSVKYHYLIHRFGELTIIVLGEFFLKLAIGASDLELAPFNIYIGLCLLGISISLWWLYFDHLEHGHLTTPRSRFGLWVYAHYPFLAAITAYGVAGNKLFAALPGEPVADEKRLLFTIALAIALLAYGAIELASREAEEPLSRKPQPWARIGGAAALLALGILGSNLGVGVLVTIVVAILFVQVGLDIYMRLKRPDTEESLNTLPGADAIA